MKKYFLLLCSVVAMAIAAHSQTIKMKIASVTPTAGETILAFQNSNSIPISATGTTGTPTFTEVKFKKTAGSSSNELFRRSVLGAATAQADFEFYDAANTLFYKIVLKDFLVSGFSNISPECSNCATLSNEISFYFKKIEITDVVANTTIRYDLTTKATY